MDEIDLVVLNKLRENSRLTYRELAELTGLSVSATHKRIRKLEDDGIINAYIARPSIMALNCLTVVIFGTSNAKSTDAVCKELGQLENIFTTAIAGGKFLYISAMLRNISELQDYIITVSRIAKISDPTIGFLNKVYTSFPEPLTGIDYKILKSLNRDARKPITDIVDDVGLTSKTVRKRLDRMIQNNLASFTIEWTPLYTDSFVSIFHIYLNEGMSLTSTIKHINDKFSNNISVLASFSNLPNFILLEIWAKTARDSHRIQEELQNEGFKDVIPHILSSIGWYECWMDKLLRTK